MRLTLLLLFSLVFLQSNAQEYFEIDLSKDYLDENTISLKYTGLKLINTLPSGHYKIKVKVEEERAAPQEAGVSEFLDSECMSKIEDFRTAFNNLKNATAESAVPSLKSKLEAQVKKLPDSCKTELGTAYKELVKETEEFFNFTFDLAKNQNIIITIHRLDEKGEAKKAWNLLLRTPRSASYISHFGFTFSPNIISEFDTYHAKAGADGEYTITKYKNDDQFWKDLSLTANFLIPFKSKRKDLSFAWASGFGVGGDTRFTVFTGPAIMISDFTSLGLGFGVNYNHKLKGIYEENQKLKEALTFDQLHDRGIRPTILLSLSFRLSKKQLQDTEVETIQ
jgi:hypothetical protein